MHYAVGQYRLFNEGCVIVEWLSEYLISVTGASIVSSGICCLSDKSKPSYAIVRLICGIFLLTIMLRPVLQLEIKIPDWTERAALTESKGIIQQSVEKYSEEHRKRITEEMTTYVQSKIKSIGCSVEIELATREEYPYDPVHIELTGAVSPYNKKYISQWLDANLGIAAEDQSWIG